jgi:hypothetical protein
MFLCRVNLLPHEDCGILVVIFYSGRGRHIHVDNVFIQNVTFKLHRVRGTHDTCCPADLSVTEKPAVHINM